MLGRGIVVAPTARLIGPWLNATRAMSLQRVANRPIVCHVLDALLDALEPNTTASESNGNRFEGRIAIHPTASVMSSVIVGPVIVGADALIADSYIGPHTSIGERVRVEGAEIERSIVLADASIRHVGGRLVASVVGREAQIFRDFSMPRALRLQVGDGDKLALC